MGDGFRLGLLVTSFGFGLRHGIDWDHIAAITDIAASQETRRRSMLYSTLYALGHASVVFVLGVMAILFAEQLPDSVDAAMERVVGATLLALGIYVVYGVARHGSSFRMRSRWMLVFAGVRRAVRRLRSSNDVVVVEHDHEHEREAHHAQVAARVAVGAGVGTSAQRSHSHGHLHAGAMPEDPFVEYGRGTSIAVGALHGVGAETPTQVLVFVAAAGVGGNVGGLVMLLAFLVGLLASNSALAVAASFGLLGGDRNRRVYLGLSLVIAVFSLVVGALFVSGRSDVLPGLFA